MAEKDPAILKLEQQKAELSQDVLNLENAKNSIQLRIEAMEKDAKDSEHKTKIWADELAAAEKAYTAKSTFIDVQIKKKQAEFDSLSVALSDKQQLFQEVEAQLKELNGKVLVAEKEYNFASESLNKMQATIDDFYQDSAERTKEIEAEIKEKEGVLSVVLSDIDKGYEKKSLLSTEIKEQEVRLTDLQGEIASERASQTENQAIFNKEIQTKKQEIESLSTELADKKAAGHKELEELEALLEAKRVEIRDLGKSFNLLEREEQLNQREEYLKERYRLAGISW